MINDEGPGRWGGDKVGSYWLSAGGAIKLDVNMTNASTKDDLITWQVLSQLGVNKVLGLINPTDRAGVNSYSRTIVAEPHSRMVILVDRVTTFFFPSRSRSC